MCGHHLPKQGGRGSPVAARAPLSSRCVSSLLEIRMKKEKRKKREQQNGAPAKRRQGPAFPQRGTRCSHSRRFLDKAGASRGCWRACRKAAGRPPEGLALTSPHSRDVQRVLKGRVQVHKWILRKSCLPAARSSHVSKTHRGREVCGHGAKDNSGCCFKLANGCPLPPVTMTRFGVGGSRCAPVHEHLTDNPQSLRLRSSTATQNLCLRQPSDLRRGQRGLCKVASVTHLAGTYSNSIVSQPPSHGSTGPLSGPPAV